MLTRLTIASVLAAAAAFAGAPAHATEVCHKQDIHHDKWLDADGLWVGACVGDEREQIVYVTCGGYYVTCAR